MSDLTNIGGLWVKTGKTGDRFFAGNLSVSGQPGKIAVMIFRNKTRKNDAQPEYSIMCPDRRSVELLTAALSPPDPVRTTTSPNAEDDEIPF